MVRLGPLAPSAARAALVQTLGNRGLTIEPALLDALLEDLTRAAASLSVEMGWGDDLAVYPPHLQLAGAMLYESLPTGATELSLSLYQRLGGLATIVGEHLHRVLEGELVPEDTAIAKDLLLALATTSTARTARAEPELVAIGRRSTQTRGDERSPRPSDAVTRVIGFLRDRGLLVSVAGREGEVYWDLAHDSLVDKIRQWITSTDLARLRALELVRYHLRRSRPGLPSFLAATEIREVQSHLGERDLDDLDAEWARPGHAPRPARHLIVASRGAVRARRTALLSLGLIPAIVAAIFGSRWWEERKLNQLRDRDIGTFELELRAFDWDDARLVATDASDGLAGMSWELRKPDAEDEDLPGESFRAGDVSSTAVSGSPGVAVYRVSARGGPAVLVVRRPDAEAGAPCRAIVIPIRRLPGFSSGGQADSAPARFPVRIPSCRATRAGMVEIPSGPYVAGGLGDPPGVFAPDELTPEDPQHHVPTYWIDRMEATNAAMAVYFEMAALHRFAAAPRPNNEQLQGTDGPPYPAIAITWREARAFCRYLGKDLPTLDQWDKALRGGPVIAGAPNPCPRRNFSRCGGIEHSAANVRIGAARAPRPGDRSSRGREPVRDPRAGRRHAGVDALVRGPPELPHRLAPRAPAVLPSRPEPVRHHARVQLERLRMRRRSPDDDADRERASARHAAVLVWVPLRDRQLGFTEGSSRASGRGRCSRRRLLLGRGTAARGGGPSGLRLAGHADALEAQCRGRRIEGWERKLSGRCLREIMQRAVKQGSRHHVWHPGLERGAKRVP